MGKVLIQVGASEEARAAVAAGVPAGRALVLPRSNVPDDVRPVEEAKPATADGEKAAEAESKPEVRPPAQLTAVHVRRRAGQLQANSIDAVQSAAQFAFSSWIMLGFSMCVRMLDGLAASGMHAGRKHTRAAALRAALLPRRWRRPQSLHRRCRSRSPSSRGRTAPTSSQAAWAALAWPWQSG